MQVKMGNRHTYSGNDICATWEAIPSKSLPSILFQIAARKILILATPSADHQIPHLPSVIDSTPSHLLNPITFLPKKYKPQDSTVLFESDNDQIPNMPGASSSLSSINSGNGLITPVYPSLASGWLSRDNPLIAGLDNNLFSRDPDAHPRSEADSFNHAPADRKYQTCARQRGWLETDT
jgi:hypothetical protein